MLFLGVLAALVSSCDSDPAVPQEPDSFRSLSEEFIFRIPRLLEEHGVPGAAVGLVINGEVVLRRGFGLADVEAERAVTASTSFRVGAMSSIFTGWGLEKLVQEARLFDDLPVEQQLTRWKFPPSEFPHDEVNLRRLLSHSGGTSLPHYVGFPPDLPLPSLVESLNGATNGAGDVRVVYEPGTETRFSSGGITVVQLAIDEEVAFTDVTFENYMFGSIFLPFRMESSDFRFTPAITGTLAVPYDEDQTPLPVRRFREVGAVGLMTSVNDLLAFTDIKIDVAGGAPFPSVDGFNVADLAAIIDQAVSPGPAYHQAYQVRDWGEMQTMGHVGSLIGWHAEWHVDPFRGHAIIVLTNSTKGAAVSRPLVCRWAEELAGSSPNEYCAAS